MPRHASRRTLVAALATLPFASFSHGMAPDPARDWENATLVEDWSTMARWPARAGESAIARALRAHASLMTNRNGEATRLFLGLDAADRAAWKGWTESLAARHRHHAIAQALAADALARAGNLAGALAQFDVALTARAPASVPLKHRAHTLVLKGTVLAQMQRADAARGALEAAIEDAPGLAEPHAALGNLMLQRRAQARAEEEFSKAIEVSKDYALAWNGLACAQYGKGDWEAADASIARAFSLMPLPLFVGNRRALLIAAENVGLPGMDDSPLFRVSDFIDWDELRRRSERPGDLMRALLGRALPGELTGELLKELNVRLANCAFSAQATRWMELQASAAAATATSHPTGAEACKADTEATVKRNRVALEQAYPELIARHTDRNPGMQLTLTKGLVDQLAYKRGLSPEQIRRGEKNMAALGVVTEVARAANIPVVTAMAHKFEQHIIISRQTNAVAYREMTGRDLSRDTPVSGVSADLRRTLVEQGPWPVVNWFGLVYATPMEVPR